MGTIRPFTRNHFWYQASHILTFVPEGISRASQAHHPQSVAGLISAGPLGSDQEPLLSARWLGGHLADEERHGTAKSIRSKVSFRTPVDGSSSCFVCRKSAGLIWFEMV